MSNIREPSPAVSPLNPAACAACEITRRGFVSMATLAALGVAVGACSSGDGGGGPTGTLPPGGGTPNPPALPSGVTLSGNTFTLDLTASNDLATVGLLVLGGAARPALVVRSATNTFVAYDARCPHQQATNLWSLAGGQLTCNNHGSRFAAADGTLAVGPATSGLLTLPVQRSGNTLTVNAA
ncbi:MAG: Rieske (2Fe-2S) protein [Gemmatimonadaceae bacterium]|jgi:nitrite reductase/ring-hydroxylating ferredoxin subunit|nr:Rieske (2Fe-2S) protein [Gemmatimonadaceae bacterium]